MMFKLCFLLAVISVASAGRITMRPCGGTHVLPDFFESPDCTATHCILQRGQIFRGRAGVTPRQVFTDLTVHLQATLFGIPFAMSIPEEYSQACNFLEGGATCPVSTATTYVWAMQLPIETHYPAIGSGLVIQLSAGYPGGAHAACGIVDAQIV